MPIHSPSTRGRRASLTAALLVLTAPVSAEPVDSPTDLGVIEVTGIRPSLASAQRTKEEASEIVDVVVAEDIAKLPDLSVTEALSRVTGVQISRDRGEGGSVAIRGLTQMETTLNGREIFTAGWSRNLDFNDIPAELVAGIDVFKSASAERIEGGIGGSVDLRTRRPFDFSGREIAVTVGGVHGDLMKETKGRFSLLASHRWETPAGEVGALISLSLQDRPWREDQKTSGAPVTRDNLIPGRTVTVPNGTSETTSAGRRERNAAHLALQWRPSESLELYAEATDTEFLTFQDSYQINVSAPTTFVAGTPTLFPGTDDLRSITWTDAPVSILSFARDTADRTSQLALGGHWAGDALILSAEVSHSESANELLFTGPFLSANAPLFTQNLSGELPSTALSGVDLLDPTNLTYTGIAYRYRPFEGALDAVRLDGEYLFDDGPLESIEAGIRLARRKADNAPGLIFADAAVSGIGGADRPEWLVANPYAELFPGSGATSIGDFLAGAPRRSWGSEATRSLFGIAAPIPTAGSRLGVWRIDEETRTAYLKANFAAQAFPLDGNLGLRVVATDESVSGHQSRPSDDAVIPIAIGHDYTDVLPSLNLRYRLGEGFMIRAALSKSLTRPDFSQLSPSLSLLRNPIDPSLNQGSAGNPELHPIRSKNLDLAVERYFSANTALHATLFTKQVDGFVINESIPEFHFGELYQVSRPRNANSADIRGVELGYQQFFDSLPGWLGGLGVQANYTWINSETYDSALKSTVSLQNLSEHSANLVGLYERGPLSVRVAYNWRDDYLSGVTNLVGVGTLPIYTEGYGWLDASLAWRLSDDLAVTFAASNLLGTERRSYYGLPNRHQSSWINDTQIGVALTARF